MLIARFREWVEANTVEGIRANAWDKKVPFVPESALQEYFEGADVVRRYIYQVYVDAPDIPVEPGDILGGYTRIFAILLITGRGKFIEEFIRHDSLSDQKLPFAVRPANFPVADDGADWFESFKDSQWQFCPHVFVDGKFDSKLEKHEILPIVDFQWHAKGGSARVAKVRFHEDYNKFRSKEDDDNSVSGPDWYALKVYSDNDAENFHNHEITAFRKLGHQGVDDSSIVRCFGSFSQNRVLAVLLEFADGGTLEDFYDKVDAPSDNEDLLKFWEALFKLNLAVESIHRMDYPDPDNPRTVYGWHQDVRPANILWFKSTTDDSFDCRFKLADMGLTHWKERKTTTAEASGADAGGTREYGAPECYRPNAHIQSLHLAVKQSVDVWSLACVQSEAAVWAVQGKRGLQRYRDIRTDATQKRGVEDIRCFHDGHSVLPEVHDVHHTTLQHARRSDVITSEIFDLLESILIRADQKRPGIDTFRYAFFRLLHKARESFDSTAGMSGDIFSNNVHHHASHGSISRADTLAFGNSTMSKMPQRWPSGKGSGYVQGRSSYANVNARASTPDVGYAQQSQPTSSSPPQMSPPIPSQRETSVNVATTHSELKNPDPQPSGLGLPAALKTQNPVLPGAQFDGQVDQPTELPHPLDKQHFGHVADRRKLSDISDKSAQSASRSVAREKSPKPVPRTGTWNKIPTLSVREANNYVARKERDRMATLSIYQQYRPELNKRDHAFLIDDCMAMQPHWESVEEIFRIMSCMVEDCDPDGVELYFTSSLDKNWRSKNHHDLVAEVSRRRPRGDTNMNTSLSIILAKYWEQPKKKFFQKAPERRGLNLYIFTAGVWLPNCDVVTPIQNMVEELNKSRLPQNMVGIQFVSFGKDPHGLELLEWLDSGLKEQLKLKSDIVDHEPSDGNVLKMLLGAINPGFDGDYLRKQSNKVSRSHSARRP